MTIMTCKLCDYEFKCDYADIVIIYPNCGKWYLALNYDF